MGNIKPVYGKKAREGLFDGMTLLNDAVKVTLGPRGRNVLMRKVFEGIHPSKDGVTVAKQIELSDELQNMGVILVKQTSENTDDDAGDGTTTSTLLAWTLTSVGLSYIDAQSNPILIKKGMDMAVSQVIKRLESYTRPVEKDMDMIESIATISANNDKSIGAIIREGLEKIGIEGTIKIEESNGMETYIDTVQGIQFDRGYSSPYFVTDTDKMEILYDSGCLVTICRDKISEYEDIKPLAEYANQEKMPLCIIADDFTNELLAGLVTRKVRNNSKVFIIKSPYFGVKRDEYLEDLSILTGTKIVSQDSSISYNNFTDSYFGHVDKCLVTDKATMMLNGGGSPEAIQKHIDFLDAKKFNTEFEEQRNKQRMDMLMGGIAVLYVGASTEAEMKEKKDRVKDALNATKAAIAEGVIPGGGCTLLRISEELDIENIVDDNVLKGFSIVKNAIKEPFYQILINSGMERDEIEPVMDYLIDNPDDVYDASEEKYAPSFGNILDPVRVTRIALQNAVSVAGTVLTTECVLVDDNIQDQENNLPDFLRH